MKTISSRLDRHPGWVIGIVAVVTALLAIPMITMAPTESASTEPTGPVFDARDAIDERFVSSVFPVFLIAEATDGNVVDAESLRDLLTAEENLQFYGGFFDVPTERPSDLLERLDLPVGDRRSVAQYSKGMKMRLVVARSLMNRPRFWFLDDALPRNATLKILKHVLRERFTREEQEGR